MNHRTTPHQEPVPAAYLWNFTKMASLETGALTEFTLFPKLPPEIQLKVWKKAMYDPRIIKIEREVVAPVGRRVTEDDDEMAAHVLKFLTPKMVARYRLPSMFQACRNSRAEIKKRYQQVSFGNMIRPIYFDAAQDTIWIGDGTAETTKDITPAKKAFILEENVRKLASDLSHAGAKLVAFDFESALIPHPLGPEAIQYSLHSKTSKTPRKYDVTLKIGKLLSLLYKNTALENIILLHNGSMDEFAGSWKVEIFLDKMKAMKQEWENNITVEYQCWDLAWLRWLQLLGSHRDLERSIPWSPPKVTYAALKQLTA